MEIILWLFNINNQLFLLFPQSAKRTGQFIKSRRAIAFNVASKSLSTSLQIQLFFCRLVGRPLRRNQCSALCIISLASILLCCWRCRLWFGIFPKTQTLVPFFFRWRKFSKFCHVLTLCKVRGRTQPGHLDRHPFRRCQSHLRQDAPSIL